MVPGEGAAFFVLSKGHAERAYSSIREVRFETGKGSREKADLDVVDLDGLSDGLLPVCSSSGSQATAYAPLYGSMMIGSAFSLAASALIIGDQTVYPNPVPDGAISRNASQPAVSSIDFIRCIRYNCEGEKSIIRIRQA